MPTFNYLCTCTSNPDNIAAHDRWVKHHEQKGNGVRTQ